jgi:hypothetical protein
LAIRLADSGVATERQDAKLAGFAAEEVLELGFKLI